MIEILSYGNQIISGKYKIHSKFNSAVNFFLGDSFVFLVNEGVGPGPLNIVIKGILPIAVKSLEIQDNCLFLNETKLFFETDKLYDPTVHLLDFNYDNFIQNLGFLERTVNKLAPPLSLAFVLDSQRRSEFNSSFECEYIRRIDSGVNEILYGNILNGVKNIKGLGPGLTPAGDDFNCGMLIAMYLINLISRAKLQQSMNMIYKEAVGCNLFTNVFLLCALNGLMFYKFRELVNAVLYSNEITVNEKTISVLSVGQTSGADQTVGFLIGMKRFLL
jgi:hypothetical protein